MAQHARKLLDDLYKDYAASSTTEQVPAATTQRAARPPTSIFAAAINSGNSTSTHTPATRAWQTELELYYSGAYACHNEMEALAWWKVCPKKGLRIFLFADEVLSQAHAHLFPILSRIAHDVLAIPGVSIGVEHLFSSCRHTLTDPRASMSPITASMTIISKEWLKRGLGDDIDYLKGISIHQ